MRQFCVQNFSSIGCNCEELSCKRTDGTDTLTDSRVYSLFGYTKMIQYKPFGVRYGSVHFQTAPVLGTEICSRGISSVNLEHSILI